MITENLDLFLQDFGVTCTAGAVTAQGILDMPSQVVADGMVLTTDYKLTCRAASFGTLKYGDSITVDGTAYTVRENMFVDDGKFCEIMLTKS
jgi:riboflavin synthase alpha subunit